MNKDVIYIEPEDDITDIITKIEKSKSKIVALVPPKKAGVFRSIVNIKLIAKSGKSAEKSIVLVTADPSIVKLAAATQLPVAKNLQSAPVVPKVENEVAKEAIAVEEIEVEEELEEEIPEPEEVKAAKSPKKAAESKDEKEDAEEEPAKEDKKKADKKEKKPKSNNKILAWIAGHKKIAIFGGVFAVGLIIFLVWAFAIAPAATLTVGVKTETNNFSESVSFVDKVSDENADEGKFYLEEKKIETPQEVSFEATGSKNVGEKATGEITVIATVSSDGGTVQVKAGDTFTNSGLTFVADNSVTMSYDGKDKSVCGNVDDDTKIKEFEAQGCKIYAKVKVTAAEPGSKYNISARDTGWDSVAPVAAYSTNAMSGGTDDVKTIVQQSDIENAKNELATSNEAANKEELYKDLGENVIVIDSSFSQKTSDAVSSPAVGEEVASGAKATLKTTTTTSVFVIDKTKVEEFITKKANLDDSKKIYAMKDPFVENFMQTSGGYTGKLKASYEVGPKITENDIADKVKGKGTGEAQHDLKNIEGVTSVSINTSYPWVTSIPNDNSKITVILEVQE